MFGTGSPPQSARLSRLKTPLFVFLTLFLVIWTAACQPAPEPAAVASTLAATAAPVPTAPPPPSPTPLPLPTALPTVVPTAIPTAGPTATARPSATPPAGADSRSGAALVWLPYGFGDYGEPLVTVRQGIPRFEAAPVPIEVFFDFQLGRGLVYGSQFWNAAANGVDSVTDLWLLVDGEDPVQLFEGGVGRAALNPQPAGEPLGIVSVHNGSAFDLYSLSTRLEKTRLDGDIDSYFSISPDGRAAAYIKEGSLRIVDLATGAVQTTAAAGLNLESGWVGDAPLWDLEREILFFPDDPFIIISRRGGEPFTPLELDDRPLHDIRPTKMLWSAELRQLVVQIEDFIEEIEIYLLTEDLRFVADRYFLEGATLVDWVDPGRTILVLDQERQLRVWSLVSYEYIEPAGPDKN